ncbi:hypothetical protein DBR42_22650 [Pelomonas sp. HMWF004]|nr:hypothetical protein DBR42_22650 [Pelomonas sp. HMWF004]
MNTSLLHRTALAMALALLTLLPPAVQAHGDEPHGDEPHPAAAATAGTPRFEAATDAFELVGRLDASGLTLFINRFATNEPVLKARVELESGPLKAVAAYREDAGSYVVSEPACLKALGQPGAHPLVVTVTAGNEADLLEAQLTVPQPAPAEPLMHGSQAAWAAGGAAVLALATGAWALRRRRAHTGVPA